MTIEVSELLKALSEHNKTTNGYQVHLNSADLDDRSARNIGVEIGDMYFTECSTLKDTMILCFGNMNKSPLANQKKEQTCIRSRLTQICLLTSIRLKLLNR